MRRALIIIAIILVLLGIGVATYFLFFARTAGIVVAPTGSVSLPVAGQQEVPDIGIVNTSSTTPVIAPVPVSARLVKISAGPVVLGEVLVDIPAKNASSSPDVAINYIERESGNVFSYLTNTKTITRTSNKTIPGIQSASWLPNASLAFVRYLSGTDFSTINTYALPANGVGGFFLPQNLADIAVSSTSVLTLTSGVNGSVASLERTDGTHAISIFSTPLSALRVSFAGKNQYLAYTKPSATLPGYAFLVSGTGRFSPVVGPQNGLVALASPSGKWVLVSYTLVNAMQMTLINTVTGETFPLPVATIADKCAWMADDSVIYCGIPMNPPANIAYPDDWYQGAVHFSDRIWKIQVSGRYAQLVLDFPKETNDDSLDAEAMAINSFGTVLSFVNKNDGSLWGYSL
ncbi:hypothetical protein COX76_01620 [Candidatus Kaiserbacteria bacterium CG_4_10_14_0_2_um_filter_50_16]|nr:MAG: hypothetical protein COX76_01620 [Candidatus Kaiserbacteria bacterium CG_4_10_14_0_2_um_filter_50_16]